MIAFQVSFLARLAAKILRATSSRVIAWLLCWLDPRTAARPVPIWKFAASAPGEIVRHYGPSVSLARGGDGCRGVAKNARARAIRAGLPRERDRRTGVAEPDGRGSEGSRCHVGRASTAAHGRHRRARRG